MITEINQMGNELNRMNQEINDVLETDQSLRRIESNVNRNISDNVPVSSDDISELGVIADDVGAEESTSGTEILNTIENLVGNQTKGRKGRTVKNEEKQGRRGQSIKLDVLGTKRGQSKKVPAFRGVSTRGMNKDL
jgi:hypothetical protein